MDSSSDDDDASACKLPEKEKAILARWAPAAQRRMLERLADRPPVRLGRAKPPHKHDVPNLFGSKKQETEIFERLKARLNRRAGRALDASLSFGQAFCAGALARLVATLLCYPFFFARISAQAGGRGGMQSVMSKIWREQGLGGLYTGLSSELARGVIFHAVNMGCLEMLRATNSRLLSRR